MRNIHQVNLTNNQDIDILSPSQLILKLSKNKQFEFTQDQFNKFIKCITYNKTKSYLVSITNSPKRSIKDKVMKLMFSKFNPSENQIKLLTSCYRGNNGYCNYSWIDELVEKRYEFSDNSVKNIILIGYPYSKLLANYSSTVEHIEIILSMLNNIVNDCHTKNIEQIILKNNIIPTKKCFLIALNTIFENSYFISYKKELLMMLVTLGTDIDQECIEIAYEHTYDIPFIDYLVTTGNVKFTVDFLEHVCGYRNKNMALFLLGKGLQPNLNCLNRIIATESINIMGQIEDINLDGNNYSDYSNSSNSSYNSENSENIIYFNLFDILILKGIKPDINTFIVAIRWNHHDIIDRLLNEFNIIPNIDCLNEAFLNIIHNNNSNKEHCNLENLNKELIHIILNYKVIPDKSTFAIINSSNINFSYNLELLISYGFAINYEILELALLNKNTILNLNRFNIKYDKYLYYLCYKYKYYPEIYITKMRDIDNKIIKLRKMFECDELSSVINYINENKLYVDRYCIGNCIKNIPVWNYFVNELKCIPPLITIINLNIENIKINNNENDNESNKNYLELRLKKYELLDKLMNEYKFDYKKLEEKYDIKYPLK